MSLNGVSQRNVNPGQAAANAETNGRPKPFNGGTVTVTVRAGASQSDAIREALMKFAAQAGIRDPQARRDFADKWIAKLGGQAAQLYVNRQAVSEEAFKNDKADGRVSVSLTPGENDAIINDLRRLQVEKGVINILEANLLREEVTVTAESEPIDLISGGSYQESLIFDPTQFRQRQLNSQLDDYKYQQQAQDPNLTELALDLTQMGLDVIGIFEPTPFADLTNTGISAVRGNWGDAALSVIGVVPYLGDVAKLGKIPKWLAAIDKMSNAIDKFSDIIRRGGKGAEAVEAFMRRAKELLDKIPFERLPDNLRDAFKSLKKKIDDFFASARKTDNPVDNTTPIMNKGDEVGDTVKNTDTVKPPDATTPKQPDLEPPKKPNEVNRQKLEELKARRAEAEAQRKLQEGIREAEAKGKLQKIKDDNIDDYNWLQADPRHKELAYDPDTKSFKVEEGRAALKAESDGLLKPPVKRAIDEYGGSRGGDYIDGNGRYWDVKDASAGVDEIVDRAKAGEDILVDARKLTEAEAEALEKAIRAKLPAGAGEVKIVTSK